MKYLVYITIILLNFNSCKAQKKAKMEQEIIIPKITKEFETFDIKSYNEGKINGKLHKYKNEELYIYIDYSKGYSKAVYADNNYFNSTKNYFRNGNIEIKGISFNNGSEYGIWYEFNKEGKLIKEINTDEGYNFGWKDILEYCYKNDIKLDKGYPKQGGIKTEIYKNEENDKKVWLITYYNYKKKQYLSITLDGKTGLLLKEKEIALDAN